MPKKSASSHEDMSIRLRIGASIREHRSRAGYKSAEIAKVASLSLAHQYRIEAGERIPDALYLIKVSKLIGSTVDGLTNFEL